MGNWTDQCKNDAQRHSQGRVETVGKMKTRASRGAQWSRGMIPALGAGGLEFESRLSPTFYQSFLNLKIFVYTIVFLDMQTQGSGLSPASVL